MLDELTVEQLKTVAGHLSAELGKELTAELKAEWVEQVDLACEELGADVALECFQTAGLVEEDGFDAREFLGFESAGGEDGDSEAVEINPDPEHETDAPEDLGDVPIVQIDCSPGDPFLRRGDCVIDPTREITGRYRHKRLTFAQAAKMVATGMGRWNTREKYTNRPGLEP